MSMIPVKVQCACGQRYAFEVEPVNARMPMPVACPVCGAEGTATANQVIAQALAAQPALMAVPQPALAAPARPALAVSAPAPAAAPAIARAQPPPVPPQAAARPAPRRPAPQTARRGKDGWAVEEGPLNKLGTYITVTPAILAGMLSWGFMGIEVPLPILCVVVGIGGVVGGILNLLGRGPLWAGILIGPIIALGGFGAVWWWMHDRNRVYKFEAMIAFAIGAAPGFLLQYMLQQVLRKRSVS